MPLPPAARHARALGAMTESNAAEAADNSKSATLQLQAWAGSAGPAASVKGCSTAPAEGVFVRRGFAYRERQGYLSVQPGDLIRVHHEMEGWMYAERVAEADLFDSADERQL